MGYVAIKGGKKAIDEANLQVQYERVKGGSSISHKDILTGMRVLVDQVMSESSLYDEELASLALKQAQGSIEEAVFLLRAHRSTLPRLYYSTICDTNEMLVKRRISASFKDILGGQILGNSLDFKPRLLDFNLLNESEEKIESIIKSYTERKIEDGVSPFSLPRVTEYLTQQGLYSPDVKNDSEPEDITKKSIIFPSTRSQRLQSLTRGQTGAVTSLGYAVIRGYGVSNHPNIGELRVGDLPLCVEIDGDEYYFGSIQVTEVECFISVDKGRENQKIDLGFEIGYGLTFGHNETKTIAMSVLDHSLSTLDKTIPTSDDEFVLLHIDSVESTGFISHLKLPHYVTFQSLLESARSIKEDNDDVSR